MNIEKTLNSLKENRFEAYYVKTSEEARALALSLIPDGATVASGGSVTLNETGILDAVRTSAKYTYLDRYKAGLSDEERAEIFEKAMTCDVYMSSSNAVTEDGALYNVDGNCNRVAAMLYGPKSVIVVVGKNKIVDNIESAVKRLKTIAAPKNAERLSCETYCKNAEHCMDEKMYGGCKSPSRICSGYTVMAFQRHAGRVKVIIVDEELGY